ncbi:hypothetical protein [Paracoccus sp. (in: a-proteobacteria)]|uniref:bestrophin-like domain n=1 Tax=Paracoccus sp. TaxID=267 RepID=UPI0032208A19
MDHFARLASYSPALFLLVLFLLMVVAREIGLWLGRRNAGREAAREGVGVVVGSMLGLLAFVLALTLSSSATRFQERRQATLDEANAISAAWSQAQVVGGAEGEGIDRLMAEYTDVRRQFVAAPPDAERLAEIDRQSVRLQGQMRDLAAAATRDRPSQLTRPLLEQLDSAFGAATTTRFAFSARLAPQIFWLLLTMTCLSVAGLGYQIGMRGQGLRVLSSLMIFMWAFVVVDILDLGTARTGSINNDTSVYQWVIEDMAGAPEPGS